MAVMIACIKSIHCAFWTGCGRRLRQTKSSDRREARPLTSFDSQALLRLLQYLLLALLSSFSCALHADERERVRDRKSTRLNSSHANISYAVFCLKQKKDRT